MGTVRRRTNAERLDFFSKKQGRAVDDLEETISRIVRAAHRLASRQRLVRYYDRQIAEVNRAIANGDKYGPERVRRVAPKGSRRINL